MSLLSIHAALTAAAHPAAAVAPAPSADSQGFGAMLGKMSEKAASPPDSTATTSGRDANEDAAASPDASTMNALQSLEAALANLAPKAAAPSTVAATGTKTTNNAATPLGTALNQAASALGDGSSTGRITIKGMLQADASLGLQDVQMRTFLGVSGATPARSGATALSADAAWTPATAAAAALEAAASTPSPSTLGAAKPVPATASTGTTATPVATLAAPPPSALAAKTAPPVTPLPVVAPTATVSPVAAAPAVTAASASTRKASGESHIAAPSSDHSVSAAPAAASPASEVVSAVGSTSAGGGGSGAGGDAASSGTAPAAAVDATAPANAAAPTVTVAFADLPAFLADQASSLAAPAATDAPAASASAATPAAARAAQAVKELNISLHPADLGEMTVKLRLANGKLSVSIAVANPTTLGAIEDDRDLIAARLAGGDQTLEDLTISRQSPVTQEATQTNGSDDSGGSSTNDGEAQAGTGRRPPSGGGAGGGGFGELLV